MNRNPVENIQSEESIQSTLHIPTELDWRRRNMTTPVQNQGSLGSSSAIVAVGV